MRRDLWYQLVHWPSDCQRSWRFWRCPCHWHHHPHRHCCARRYWHHCLHRLLHLRCRLVLQEGHEGRQGGWPEGSQARDGWRRSWGGLSTLMHKVEGATGDLYRRGSRETGAGPILRLMRVTRKPQPKKQARLWRSARLCRVYHGVSVPQKQVKQTHL